MSSDQKRDIDLSELHLLLRGAHLKSAPESLVRNVQSAFDHPKRPQVTALLVFDSLKQLALAGSRGGTATSRQMVLRAEDFDIHLKIWGSLAGRRMVGQVLGRGEGAFVHGARLHLLRDGERIGSTTVDKFGEFEFEILPEGFLSLQVDLPYMTLAGELNASEAS